MKHFGKNLLRTVWKNTSNLDFIWSLASDKPEKKVISEKHAFGSYSLSKSANKTIENFINKAFSENINKLIIVTGKGLHSENEKDPYVSKKLSILKYSVPEFIENNIKLMSMINDIQDAKIEDGGSGAFYILLKKNKN